MRENREASFLDYFTEACEYAQAQCSLDVLFVTPHTKTGTETATDTPLAAMIEMQRKLVGWNSKNANRFYFGLGQEVSSIAAGNHLGVLGHLTTRGGPKSDSLYFPAGRFDIAYREIKARSRRGEKIVLQLNHPVVAKDLL